MAARKWRLRATVASIHSNGSSAHRRASEMRCVTGRDRGRFHLGLCLTAPVLPRSYHSSRTPVAQATRAPTARNHRQGARLAWLPLVLHNRGVALTVTRSRITEWIRDYRMPSSTTFLRPAKANYGSRQTSARFFNPRPCSKSIHLFTRKLILEEVMSGEPLPIHFQTRTQPKTRSQSGFPLIESRFKTQKSRIRDRLAHGCDQDGRI